MEVRVLPGQQNSGIIVSVLPPPLQRYTGAGIVAQLVEQQTENLCVVGSIPTGTTESRYNGKPPLPYGSRSINPVKWGKIALVVEWLSHIPDKNEKKVQFLPRVQNLKCGIRY